MMASLYQDGSSSSVKPSGMSGIVLVLPCSNLRLLSFQNMLRRLARPQLHLILRALPHVPRTSQQVKHRIVMPSVNSQFVCRQFQDSGLFPHRIETYYGYDDVPFIRCVLAVADDLIIVDRMKPQAFVRLQRGIFLPNCIHPFDESAEARRIVEIPALDLIFLGIKILFASWFTRHILAKLVCRTVHSVVRS